MGERGDYEPTPARQLPAIKQPVTWYCPRCKMSIRDREGWYPLREFCPSCLCRFLEKHIPRLTSSAEAESLVKNVPPQAEHQPDDDVNRAEAATQRAPDWPRENETSGPFSTRSAMDDAKPVVFHRPAEDRPPEPEA